MVVRRAWVALLFALACRPGTIGAGYPAEGYATEILIVKRSGSVRAWVYALSGQPIRTQIAPDLGADVEIEALLYDRAPRLLLFDVPPSGLELDLGPNVVDAEPLPAPAATYTLSVHGGSAGPWTKAQGPSAVAQAIRIGARDRRLCSGGDLCFIDDPKTPDPHCQSPCGADAPDSAALPASALLPAHEGCPPGWSEEVINVPDTACMPPPPVACPDGQYQLAGAASCAPLGDPCPSGQWTTGLDARAIYVAAGAPSGGLGTRAAPYSTIQEALAHVTGTATVAVAAGTYRESIVLSGGIALLGACASGTVIASDPTSAAAVSIEGPSVSVANLTVKGGQSGISVGASGVASFRGVVADGAGTSSIAVSVAGRLHAVGSAFLHALVGLDVGAHAAASVEGSIIAGNTLAGARVDQGVLSLKALSIGSNGIGGFATGGVVGLNATIDVEDSALDGNNVYGVALIGESANATVAHSVVRGTRAVAGPHAGVSAIARARVALRQVVFDHNEGTAFFAGTGGYGDIRDSWVHDTVAPPNLGCGFGVVIENAGLLARRLAVVSFQYEGLRFDGSSTADVEDLEVAGSHDSCDTPSGLRVIGQVQLRLARALFIAVRGRAIRMENDGALPPGMVADISDLFIVGKATSQHGMIAASGSQLTLTRAHFTALDEFGLRISGRSNATLKDITVDNIAHSGLYVAEDAVAGITRARIADTQGAAVYLPGHAVLSISDLAVAGCPTGLEVNAEASLDVRRFSIEAGGIAVLADDPQASIRLQDGRIEGNQTGASYPNKFDYLTLLSRVLFHNTQEFTVR